MQSNAPKTGTIASFCAGSRAGDGHGKTAESGVSGRTQLTQKQRPARNSSGPVAGSLAHQQSEYNHAANHVAGLHFVEGVLHIFQTDPARHHAVEVQLSLEIELGKEREIVGGERVAAVIVRHEWSYHIVAIVEARILASRVTSGTPTCNAVAAMIRSGMSGTMLRGIS